MPIYEYQCERCQHCFERLVFAGDQADATCPKCGAENARKLMSASRISTGGIGAACASGGSSGFS